MRGEGPHQGGRSCAMASAGWPSSHGHVIPPRSRTNHMDQNIGGPGKMKGEVGERQKYVKKVFARRKASFPRQVSRFDNGR